MYLIDGNGLICWIDHNKWHPFFNNNILCLFQYRTVNYFLCYFITNLKFRQMK